MAPASVKTIVDRTLAVVEHKLQMQGIALSCEIAELPEVYCDASQIQQVLTAIIMNAVDAITGGGAKGGNLRVRAAAAGEGRVDIAVTNDGPPIPVEVLPHIFEPFFSTKLAASGVGLGLAVTYGIVKRHGGEIQVETGAETTFHVILPVGEVPAPPESEKEYARTKAIHPDRG
jgi:signal transduction histidine kinase